MPSQTHLLNRAYNLMQNNKLSDAELVLESLVASNPQDLDAWKAYIGLCQNPYDLEKLKERIITTREIRAVDKFELIVWHNEALREMHERESPYARMAVDADDGNPRDPQEANIIFELLEEFHYTEPRLIPAIQPVLAESKKITYDFPEFSFGLLAVFFIAVRFLVLGYFAGLPLLILFVCEVFRWLDESSKGK